MCLAKVNPHSVRVSFENITLASRMLMLSLSVWDHSDIPTSSAATSDLPSPGAITDRCTVIQLFLLTNCWMEGWCARVMRTYVMKRDVGNYESWEHARYLLAKQELHKTRAVVRHPNSKHQYLASTLAQWQSYMQADWSECVRVLRYSRENKMSGKYTLPRIDRFYLYGLASVSPAISMCEECLRVNFLYYVIDKWRHSAPSSSMVCSNQDFVERRRCHCHRQPSRWLQVLHSPRDRETFTVPTLRGIPF